jgi:hypothetical protein
VTETSRGTITVPDLKCRTDYEFKVRAVNKDGDEGPFSPKLKMSTKMSLAKWMQRKSKREILQYSSFHFLKVELQQISKRKLGNVFLASIFYSNNNMLLLSDIYTK